MRIVLLIPQSRFAKNVARDLIYGCWCKGKRIAGIEFPPISQLQIVTILQQLNLQAELYDAAAMGKTIEDIKKELLDVDIIIVLTATATINEDAAVLAELKKDNRKLLTLVYGAHPTFMPKYTLSKKGIDIAVRREAELVIRDLTMAISKGVDWRAIKGISFLSDGKFVSNPDYEYIGNLDSLPIPDRTLLSKNADYFNPVVKRLPFTTMFTSRGCPGNCTYCSSPPFYGRVIRSMGPERVAEEMSLIQSQGYREIFFRDEIFTINKNRTTQICEKIIEKELDLTWIASARIGSVDFETMKLMKKAGCHMIRFGVESGSQKILNNIKKGITIDQTRRTFEWIHRAGLDTHAHLMIGAPGESKETIDQTIRLLKEIKPAIITCGICMPYPGTQLFDYVLKSYPEIGDGSECDLSHLHTQGYYNELFCDLSYAELAHNIKRIYRNFYLRPEYIFSWFKRIKTLDEVKRVFLAGCQIFEFMFTNDG